MSHSGQLTTQALRSILNSDWSPEFSKRRELHCEAENQILLETIAEVGSEHRVGSRSRLVELEDSIKRFMQGHHGSDIVTPEADIVLAFCYDSSFERLLEEPETVNRSLQQNAWLDDRNFRDGGVQARAQKGPLTALELYTELKKPVSSAACELQPSFGVSKS